VHVLPKLLTREEVEAKPLDAKNRRTHSDKIAQRAEALTVYTACTYREQRAGFARLDGWWACAQVVRENL
jgi:hypothetical protein